MAPRGRLRRRLRKAVQGFTKTVDPRRAAAGIFSLMVMSLALYLLLRSDKAPRALIVQPIDESTEGEFDRPVRPMRAYRPPKQPPPVPQQAEEAPEKLDDASQDDSLNTDDALRKAAASGNTARQTFVVMVSNYGYRELAMNTVCQLRRLGMNKYVLFALDKEMHDFAMSRNISVVPLRSSAMSRMDTKAKRLVNNDFPREAAVFGSNAFVKVSLAKSAAVLPLLHKGFDVLFADVDISWRQNPLSRLSESKADIVTTSDAQFGTDDVNKPNAKLNSGLFLARSSPAVQKAFNEMVSIGVRSGRSHQKAYNWVLCGQYKGELRGRGKLVGDDNCAWHDKDGGVSVQVMSLDLFPNGSGWPTTNAVTVHHNYMPGIESKIEAIRSEGRWLYDDSIPGYCTAA